MKSARNTRRLPLIAPTVVLVLLAGVAVQRGSYAGPDDFEPFHQRVADAVTLLPTNIGTWRGKVVEPTQAAITLLQPNVLHEVRFEDLGTEHYYRTDSSRFVSVVLVQCKSSRDMLGHYPPLCYPNVFGETLVDEEARNWSVAGTVIPGTSYHFTHQTEAGTSHRRVYNFMIVPGAGAAHTTYGRTFGEGGGAIVRDMEGLNDAAQDYRRRYYGAAQVQVVFHGNLATAPQAERDAIFAELLEPMLPVVDLLKEGLAHPSVARHVADQRDRATALAETGRETTDRGTSAPVGGVHEEGGTRQRESRSGENRRTTE